MNWEELKQHVPETASGAVHSNVVDIYTSPEWSLRIKQPGKYGASDFVVEVTDSATGWKWKKFRIDHLFDDVQAKRDAEPEFMETFFVENCANVIVNGADPLYVSNHTGLIGVGIDTMALHYALQSLALAEHRRYGYNERIGGGRYLPYRFCAGIATGHWSAEQATLVFRQGMRGLIDLQARGGREPSLRAIGERIRNGVSH